MLHSGPQPLTLLQTLTSVFASFQGFCSLKVETGLSDIKPGSVGWLTIRLVHQSKALVN